MPDNKYDNLYLGLGLAGVSISIMWCRDCGAAVVDTAAHDKVCVVE